MINVILIFDKEQTEVIYCTKFGLELFSIFKKLHFIRISFKSFIRGQIKNDKHVLH